jgi:hypothetical protein
VQYRLLLLPMGAEPLRLILELQRAFRRQSSGIQLNQASYFHLPLENTWRSFPSTRCCGLSPDRFESSHLSPIALRWQ